MGLNNKGMTFGGFVFLLVALAGFVWFLTPFAITVINDTKMSLFVSASLSGSNTLRVNEIYMYDDLSAGPFSSGNAKLYNFSELEITKFDHNKYDMSSSYILAIKKEGSNEQFTYYVNFKTHDDLDDYKQIVMVKREDVRASAVTFDKDAWIEKPFVGDVVVIDGKEYTIIE